MVFDYSKLSGKIKEKYGSLKNFAEALGTSGRILSKKLNNISNFKQEEISKAIELLEIPENEIIIYFFKEKVQKFEQKNNRKGEK